MNDKVRFLYRFTDSTFDGDFVIKRYRVTDCATIRLVQYAVLRTTPCGWWILAGKRQSPPEKKWVASGIGKRFAYPTKKAALESYRKRKQRQIEILESQLTRAFKLREEARIIPTQEDAE